MTEGMGLIVSLISELLSTLDKMYLIQSVLSVLDFIVIMGVIWLVIRFVQERKD